jgi:hypothetical protein
MRRPVDYWAIRMMIPSFPRVSIAPVLVPSRQLRRCLSTRRLKLRLLLSVGALRHPSANYQCGQRYDPRRGCEVYKHGSVSEWIQDSRAGA